VTNRISANTAFAAYIRRMVLEQLREEGTTTRRALADSTGLSRTGLASVLDSLLTAGLVVESDPSSDGHTRVGRPARMIALAAPEASWALVFVVRPRQVSAAIVSSTGEIACQSDADIVLSAGAPESLSRLVEMGRELRDRQGTPVVTRILLSLPTLIETGGIVNPHGARELMPTWIGPLPIDTLIRAFSLPLAIHNETRLLALGESHHGAAKGAHSPLYVKIGAQGSGMAILSDGREYTGANGIAGQLGHVSVSENGVRCPCGQRGCLAAEIDAQIQEEVGRRMMRDPAFTVDELISGAEEGEPAARRLLFDIGGQAAQVLGGAINILNPDRVIIGGDLGWGSTGLFESIEQSLPLFVHPSLYERVDVVRAELGSGAGLIGGGLAAAETESSVGSQSGATRTFGPALT